MHLFLYQEFSLRPRTISAGKPGHRLTSAEPDGAIGDPDRNGASVRSEPAILRHVLRPGSKAPAANFATASKLARKPSCPSGSPPPSSRLSATPRLRRENGQDH